MPPLCCQVNRSAPFPGGGRNLGRLVFWTEKCPSLLINFPAYANGLVILTQLVHRPFETLLGIEHVCTFAKFMMMRDKLQRDYNEITKKTKDKVNELITFTNKNLEGNFN